MSNPGSQTLVALIIGVALAMGPGAACVPDDSKGIALTSMMTPGA